MAVAQIQEKWSSVKISVVSMLIWKITLALLSSAVILRRNHKTSINDCRMRRKAFRLVNFTNRIKRARCSQSFYVVTLAEALFFEIQTDIVSSTKSRQCKF